MSMADFIRGFDFYKDLPKDLQEPSVSGASGMYCFDNDNFSFDGRYVSDGTDVYLVDLYIHAVLKIIRGDHRCQHFGQQGTLFNCTDTCLPLQLNINMNITMHRAPCHILSLDVVDVTGVHVVDVAGRLHKHRIDRNGNYIGVHDIMDDAAHFSNAGQSHEEIYRDTLKALDDGEGCIVEGTAIINKVPGNFHLSTHAFGPVIQ